MGLKFVREKCIGCRLCQLACSSAKEAVFNPLKARLSISSYYSKDQLCIEGRVCTLCGVCMEACPTEAIRISDGALQYDADSCTSCNVCLEACPEKVIAGCGDGVAICDLCGGEPKCVRWCPHEALLFGEVG